MHKFLIATLALFAFASAQETDVAGYTALIASDISAVVTECPDYLANIEVGGVIPESACFTFDGSQNLLRLSLEDLDRNYSDVEWRGPWRQVEALLLRRFAVADVTFTMFVIELGDYEQLVNVVAID